MAKSSDIKRMLRKAQRELKLLSYPVEHTIRSDMDTSDFAEICYGGGPGSKVRISFNADKLNDDLEDTIVHELLHLFLYKYLGVAETTLEQKRMYKKLKNYQRGQEKAITILAALLKKSIFPKR